MNNDRPGDQVHYQRRVKVLPQLSPVLRSPNQALELPIALLKELGMERAEQFWACVKLADNL